MPDLFHSLQNHDLGYLHIVGNLWGLEFKANDFDDLVNEIVASLLDPALAAELIDSLPPDARAALDALAATGGRIPWAAFARQFGDVREMGAGKRDREKPYLKPASACEVLYYRALLARAFFDTDKGPQEFAYVPDDLLPLIGHEDTASQRTKRKESAGLRDSAARFEPLGRNATPSERKHILPASDRVLDDATTLLAALRLGREPQLDPTLIGLLSAARLLKKNVPQADKVKAFLEAPRADALRWLADAWRASETFNELRLIPGLTFEGEWKNQPHPTREFLFNWLEAIPAGTWWNLDAFVDEVKKRYPDFQRPAGDYDSWFIKRTADGEYLRGFACWDQVDGALIRFFITEILYRLGMLDLASAGDDAQINAFRIAGIGSGESGVVRRITDTDSRFTNIESGKLKVASNGKISAPRLVPRSVRYQLARFCEWDEEKPDEYRYHLTPRSLTIAREHGLKVEHLLALLAKHADAGIPPATVKALKRWEANGTEVRAESQVILRVSRPEILAELRKSKAGRFLGEALGPTSVIIKTGAQAKVMAALAELGLLGEDSTGKSHEA